MTAPLYIVCVDELHAELVDALLCEHLRDVDGNKGSRWAGVATDGTRYGVLWAPEVGDVFGIETLDLAEAVHNEAGEWNWKEVPAPVEEPSM